MNSQNTRTSTSAIAAVTSLFLLSAAAQAGISGINTPVTSTASVNFDDTGSQTPALLFGTTNGGPSSSPWTGSLVSLGATLDPITGDLAQGDISASFLGNTYAVNFNNVVLNQAVNNSGFADLIFTFNVEFQIDALGLPAQATLFPSFQVNGTVQNIAGSFAAVSGAINYSGVNTAGTISTFETVTYGATFNTPGNFNAIVPGVPTVGTTPALVPNTTLTLDGVIRFRVDPANISANSVMVPEPSVSMLALTAAAMLASRRRRR